MRLELHNPENTIEESYYAWRYMNNEKLMSLIKDNELYFARLDQFKDPLEGLTLRDRHMLSMIRMTKEPNVLPEFKRAYENEKVFKSNIRKWQNGLYASCWYLSKYKNEESISMWDLYTNKDSFAISINFKILKDLLQSSLADFGDEEIIAALYGKIEYLGAYDHSMRVIHTTENSMPGFIKTPSYQHENEVRLMLIRGEQKYAVDRVGISIKLVQSLAEFKDSVSIFTHPDMDIDTSAHWINYLNSLGYNAFMSSVLTKKNIKNFLTD